MIGLGEKAKGTWAYSLFLIKNGGIIKSLFLPHIMKE